jgi:phosphoglycerol transferase MdoB-like AlkP superfamily enzyme
MKNIKEKLKIIINEHYILLCVVLSFVLNFAIESAARLSFLGGILYTLKHPFYFLYNTLLLLFTYLIALFFKKRIFSISLVTVWWIIACITNAVLINYRHTPFSAADFMLIKSALNVMHVYISNAQLALIIISSIIVVLTLILILKYEKLKTPDYRKISVLLSISIILSLLPTGFITAEKDRSPKANLTEEAHHYGFVCCFFNSIFNNGIKKPDEYSENSIYSIIDSINTNQDQKTTPNIVVIQLESFVDPYLIKTSEYNKDPIPNFRKLKNEHSSGKLGVSVYGGGTANTEFEVLTSMSLNFFGIGEYPFETILHNRTVESLCYNLDELGYTSHAIHNHTGTFYDRYLVYKNLGFDTFTPIEYMNNVTLNALGWAKSDVLTDYILDSMNSTKGQDFVFTVTVQGHGKYPEKKNPNYEYKLTNGSDIVMGMKGQLDYYINELHEEDVWLGEMITALREYPEPVIAVIYGDHMPSLNSPEDVLNPEDIYSTEYVIWTNYESEKIDRNLETYNLIPYALSHLNINNGILTKLHQYGLQSGKIYSDDLHKIQYDMLYGEKFVYNQSENFPHLPTDMKLGIYDIIIEDVQNNKVIGKNFTPYSVVNIDGNDVETTFIDENTLKFDSREFSIMTVRQKSENSIILSESQPYYNNN